MSADPTRIDLRTDPRAQRMSGVAFHGNTPFDVPYISEVAPHLWQGGCASGLTLPEHIKHVVSLYPWERYSTRHELSSFVAVRLYDAAEVPDREQMLLLARWVNLCRLDAPVLVHCQAGLNRSGLLAGLALVLDGMDPREAVALLRSTRSGAVLCNRTFESWLVNGGWRPAPEDGRDGLTPATMPLPARRGLRLPRARATPSPDTRPEEDRRG